MGMKGKKIPIIKFPVTERAIGTIENVMCEQDEYGYQKYRKPLKHTMPYNWLQMGLEELADLIKYIQCEIDRKKQVVDLLEFSLGQDDPNSFIIDALEILKIEGTGK